jgi:hypothetical protein
MARSKQTAVKSAGRQKIAKQSARTTKAPVKKSRAGKSKAYVSPPRSRCTIIQPESAFASEPWSVVEEGFAGCGWVKGTKTSWVDSGNMMDADIRYHSSGKIELEDANAGKKTTPNGPSSAVVQSPRSVRGSYDQAPK